MATKRILVVEDEKPLNHALSLKLTHEGYEVVSAFDGEECLELIEKNDFDLILLDLIMPKLDGFSVLKKLKNMHKNTTIIVLSNSGQPEDKERSQQLGAKGFFIKSDMALSGIVALVSENLSNK